MLKVLLDMDCSLHPNVSLSPSWLILMLIGLVVQPLGVPLLAISCILAPTLFLGALKSSPP
ncbi:hypothetical protein RchiOBHm_Chr0c11g0499541 [Rosa chinensis]|uniref:Uncharacterized protein n=1 Tax=Rosa chinensis TaxID=74649 RepID=A0A2P6SQQ8_ROSCH|nr:hypothetical protein RchiOBHm_Chr0c11g0499541 [Rosa chinensis]